MRLDISSIAVAVHSEGDPRKAPSAYDSGRSVFITSKQFVSLTRIAYEIILTKKKKDFLYFINLLCR